MYKTQIKSKEMESSLDLWATMEKASCIYDNGVKRIMDVTQTKICNQKITR